MPSYLAHRLAIIRSEAAGNKTTAMTVGETANYLQSQHPKGWPGSRSISGRFVQRASGKQ